MANWFKKISQHHQYEIPLVDNRNKKDTTDDGYYDIGHDISNEPIYLWVFRGGEIDIEKVKEEDDDGFEYTAHDSVKRWKNIPDLNVFMGRYDSSTGFLSIYVPKIYEYRPIPSYILNKLKCKFPDVKKMHIFAKNKKNIKTSQLMEEYWIDEYGQSYFADGDIGDMNHELYVIKKIIEDKLDIDYENYDFYDIINMNTEELMNKGFDNEEIMILKNKKDPREYAMKKWGWIRGIGNNLQIWKIDDRVIRNIANGIYEVFGENIFKKTFNIEILKNNTIIDNIPFEIIDRESIKELWFHINSQNKFAQLNTPISIYSYSKTYGELKILFNNKGPYTYYNVSLYMYDKIRNLLHKNNYSYANKILRSISKNTPHTEEEQKEMLDELYERGYLK